jgi:hypothetical protein
MTQGMRRAIASALVAACTTSCATTTSVVVPPCAERVEVEGQHDRAGRRLTFDHSLDPPWAVTEIVLERDGQQERLSAPHLRPDGGRLLVASVFGVLGAGLVAIAGYDLAVRGGAVDDDDGPFYAGVFGAAGLTLGALLGLTGWQPVYPSTLSAFCGEDD